jgi:phosphatidylglycerol lysyltransferase
MDAQDSTLIAEPDLSAQSPPPAWLGWLVRVASVLWVAVCVAALYGLHEEWSGFSLAQLNHALARIGPRHLAAAVAFTALSYLCNAALGLLAVVWVGRPLDQPWRELFVSYISSAFTMNAGGTLLGGGSIRMRFASATGSNVGETARITMFTGLAGWAGHALACAVLLIFSPPPLAWLPVAIARAVGFGLLGICVGLLAGSLVWKSRWPSPGLALLTFAISALDWLCAGLAMWALFPGALPIGAWAFVAVVIIAQAVAAVTHVPGGVGVLEVTITKALSGAVAAPALAGALLTYRLIYYLLPFFLAIAMLQVRELRLRRVALRRGGKFVSRGWNLIAPRLAALLALGGGFVLLLSANTPMEQARRAPLEALLPLPFVETSHFISSLAGALLILLARGLQRRIQAAWWLTVVLMASGIVFSLTKGFDWEEALVLAFMLACLLPSREHFHRQAALWTHRFTFGWWMMILSLVGVSVWLGYFTARDVGYRQDLWWQFAFDSDASRSLRAAVGACGVFAIIAVAQGLRAAKPRTRSVAQASVVEKLVEHSGRADAALAFLGDKDFTVSPDGVCGLMHADQGRSRIVMGDPLGDRDGADDLLWRFVEMAEDEGMRPVFYQVSVDEMPRMVDMGFKLFKLGEEAHVALDAFTLEGSEPRKLRQALSHFQRTGHRFAIWDRDTVTARIEELHAISDAWLGEHRAGEKGFSLGFFDDEYVTRFPCAVVTSPSGEPVAFANIWASADKAELSVDLMRSLPTAPSGVMEAMFIELMVWGREQGYRSFNLGMAPLSGLSTHPLAPLWHRLAARVFRRGEALYNFQGLRSFKDKFSPEWEPRYIAVPGTWSLPAALLDATALIGGGLQNTLGRESWRGAGRG